MRAAECPCRFVLLAGGGARADWACGASIERPDEDAVDVAILAERFGTAHHHQHHLLHRPA